MTETPAKQLARLQRSLLRHPSLEAVLGGSPLEVVAARNVIPALVFHLSPAAGGGAPCEPETTTFYKAAALYVRSDGGVSDIDLLRAANDTLPDKASKKPAKLRERFKRGKDATEQESAFAWIVSQQAAKEYLGSLLRTVSDIETRERDVTKREMVVAEKDADATRKLERAREIFSETVLRRSAPPTTP
ncbi:hypothetical protein U91I_01183 [alpha proteobacterium U9-1i]|nr:hypothetical protein U91I_01183 [alpha proteobacterium U9-1i]